MFIWAWAGRVLTRALSLVPSLPQTVTNGGSTFGTLKATPLDAFLKDHDSPPGFPWGNLTATNCNPETDTPFTGVTRKYDFIIERGLISPDGYQKQALLVNGQFPGPLIEANWGDMISVTIHNKITNPDEGTSLHWHGFLQKATPWYDGVPAVTQCPIAPGGSFTYTFRADMYGTTWYHSHYSAQYSTGLLGPMVIHGPEIYPYDIDLGPVFLSDWFHTEYTKILDFVHSPGPNVPRSDNNLINGKMTFNCSSLVANDTTPCTPNAGLSKFKFTTGKTHRLRLINAGAEGLQRFSIDEHEMTVIANDFVPIQPYTTKVVTLSPGQRSDVVVTGKAGSSESQYWMRSNISTICSNTKQPNALAAVYYEKADVNSIPNSNPWNVSDPGTCQNDPLAETVPLYSMTPTPSPAVTRTLQIDAGLDSTGHLLWYFNQSSYRPNVDDPLLLLANEGNFSYPDNPQWNVYNFNKSLSIRIVLINNTPAHHPMHLHGHNMFVLAEGTGTWDGIVVNPGNPQRRDTQLVSQCIYDVNFVCLVPRYIVIQINADNPGIWPFHCHVAWHLSAGLYANIMERPTDIDQMQIPSVIAQTCKDWNKYIESSSFNQLDPGLVG